jgi:hypothetical protein
MAKYFINFPKTVYNLNGANSLDLLTNITSSFSFDRSLTENSVLYYEYTVADGETPEIVAHKLYGSVENHWILLKLNEIIDVKTDWPLEQRNLIKFIDEKYSVNGEPFNQSGYQWAFNNTHSYYKIESRTLVASGEQTVDKIQIDANTFANVVSNIVTYTLQDNNLLEVETSRTLKTYYEYETELNEAKRNIKVLRPEFVPSVTDEFIRVMTNGG